MLTNALKSTTYGLKSRIGFFSKCAAQYSNTLELELWGKEVTQ